MGILGALSELSRKSAVTANADRVLSTAAGLIMVDTKHWTGELSLDENGQFTAGPNHPGNQYRQKVAKVTRFEASRIKRGDVAMIVLAVVGGTVKGGRVEQREEGEIPIIAVEAKDVARIVTEIHNADRLREPASMISGQGNSPAPSGSQRAPLIVRPEQIADGVVPPLVELRGVTGNGCHRAVDDPEFCGVVVDVAVGGVLAALRPLEGGAAVLEWRDVVDPAEEFHLSGRFAVDIERQPVGD